MSAMIITGTESSSACDCEFDRRGAKGDCFTNTFINHRYL